MIEIEMTDNVPNPIINPYAATSKGDDSSPSQRAIDTDSFPKELLEWIVANQSSSFEKLQRKSMRQPIYSEGDAMQYWLTRATSEDMHDTCTFMHSKHSLLNATHAHTHMLATSGIGEPYLHSPSIKMKPLHCSVMYDDCAYINSH